VSGSDTTRDTHGRFVRGNPGGPGNPHAGRVSQLRAAIIEAVDADDIRAIITRITQQAREGDLAAARELLDRTIGRPSQADLLARIEALEVAAERMGQGGNHERRAAAG